MRTGRVAAGKLQPGRTSAGSSPVAEERLREVIQRIVEAFDPQRIILFGSHAYGEPTPDSDVDLLVAGKRRAASGAGSPDLQGLTTASLSDGHPGTHAR